MASSAAVARLRELTTAPAPLRSPSAARSSCAPAAATPRPRTRVLEALCAAGGGDAMRSHADGLAPLVVARLGDGDAAVREAARRFLVVLMEAAHGGNPSWLPIPLVHFNFIRSLVRDYTGASDSPCCSHCPTSIRRPCRSPFKQA